MSQYYREFRCKKCNKLQFKGLLLDSEVEVKCKGCSVINVFQGEKTEKFICLKKKCPNRIIADTA